MSFDVFLDCFRSGNFSKFPRQIAWEQFGPYAVGEFGHYEVRFPDGSGGYLDVDDDDLISGFGVNRPSAGMLYDAIFAIMRQTTTLLYWSDGAVVANSSVAFEIPPKLIEALGVPRVVHSGDEIVARILASKPAAEFTPRTVHGANDDGRSS